MAHLHRKSDDVAIVGGGIGLGIGLSCAWNLAKSGARVGLFERARTGQPMRGLMLNGTEVAAAFSPHRFAMEAQIA